MTKFRNYLGQLRLYSLVDLILMVMAYGLNVREMLGATVLWVAFLATLEDAHRHKGRWEIPDTWPMGFMAGGLLIFGHAASGYVFAIFSVLYCFKNRPRWALVSPLFRGLQTAALIWTHAAWPGLLLAGSLITVRNVLGDARDTSKDGAVGMLTWPVLLNWSDHKYLHLIAVMTTSGIWCAIANFSPILLAGVWILQLATYWLTPR